MKVYLTVKISEALKSAQKQGLLADFALPAFQVNRPVEAVFGEYTSNIALMTAKLAGQPPRALAEIYRDMLLTADREDRAFCKD
jgi:arginyl-tRNA synthetase